MKNKILITIGILGLLMAISGVLGLVALKKYSPHKYTSLKTSIKNILNIHQSPKSLRSSYSTKIRRDKYHLHKTAGKKQNVGILKTDGDIKKKVTEKLLKKITNTDGFKLAKLQYSKPVLSGRTKEVLLKIGKEFSDKTEGQYFTITSLTRSVETQKKLTKSNSNATKGTSSHSYGVSFDISSVRFNGERKVNWQLQEVLETILKSYQKNKKIYIIYEKFNKCYHITVI